MSVGGRNLYVSSLRLTQRGRVWECMCIAWCVQDAIKTFETMNGIKASEAEKVNLFGQIPPIEKMDSTLASLKACKYVAARIDAPLAARTSIQLLPMS